MHEHVGGELRHRSRAIVDDDRLTEFFAQTLGVKAADHIDQRASRRGDEQMDWPSRIIVGAGAERSAHHQRGQAKQSDA